jgi:hypothetical protein
MKNELDVTFQSRGAQMVETKKPSNTWKTITKHPKKSLKVALLPLWLKDDL